MGRRLEELAWKHCNNRPSGNATVDTQTTLQASTPPSTDCYNDGSTKRVLPREQVEQHMNATTWHREELEPVDPSLSDHFDTIQSSVFPSAVEASFDVSNLVAGATEPSGVMEPTMCSSGVMEPTMCTDMIAAPGAMELVPLESAIVIRPPRDVYPFGASEATVCTDITPAAESLVSTMASARADTVCLDPSNMSQRIAKHMEVVSLEPTRETRLPADSPGPTEPNMCTDIPTAAGATEPREGLSCVSTPAIAPADTVCCESSNIPPWNISGTYITPMELVPLEHIREIRLELTHHRSPDIGVRIRVTMPHEDKRKVYIGEYYGHGQSKTAFILKDDLGDEYNGKILKVTAEPDIEPSVFKKMTERSPGITSRILYCSLGYGSDQQRYYCWITERTIPLDRLLKSSLDVLKQRCILAAMLCLAQCAQNGLLLSDNNFFNLGVPVNKEEQHCIVVIDAGWRPLENPNKFSKKDCTAKVARRIWHNALEHGAPCERVRELWNSKHSLPEVITLLHKEWMKYPYLVKQKRTTEQIQQDMTGEASRDLTVCERWSEGRDVAPVSSAMEPTGESTESITRMSQPENYTIYTPPLPEWRPDAMGYDALSSTTGAREPYSDGESSSQEFLRHAFLRHPGPKSADLWKEVEPNPDHFQQTPIPHPCNTEFTWEIFFNDLCAAIPLISQQSVCSAYDLDGNLYTTEAFREYYGDAFEERWAIANQVTQDIVSLTEQLTRKRGDDHDFFKNALDVIVRGWKCSEYSHNALSVLAKRFLKPLWWRADTLRKSGGDMATTAPMAHTVAEDTWHKWRQHFYETELTPEQRLKSSRERRSIFNLVVHKEIGCVHVAQALITFGARGDNKIDDIIVDVYRAKETECHKEAIRQTHNTDQNEATQRARHQYRAATYQLRTAKRVKEKYPWTSSIHSQKLLGDLQSGELHDELYKTRQEHHKWKPATSSLMKIIDGMRDTRGKWSGTGTRGKR